MATNPLRLNDGLAVLTREARRDLFLVWERLARSADVEAALRDVLPTLIEQYGLAAAALAADWYDDLREAAGAPGRFRAITANVDDAGAQSLVGWALNEAKDDAGLQVLVAGGMQRRIANFARETVARSSYQDPSAVGWARIGYGSCSFCRMLIGRGDVYRSDTAKFASHDHCNCQAYPVIEGAEPVDVTEYVRSEKSAQQPGESDAAYQRRRATDRARAREWIEQNL